MWSTVDKVIFTLCIMGIAYPFVLAICDEIRFSWKLRAIDRLIRKSSTFADPKERRAHRLKALELIEQLAIENGLNT